MKTIFSIVIFILIAGGIYIWRTNSTISKEEAIRQAKQYVPDGFCTQIITPAIHKATGAEYTFDNGCLPPGWETKFSN